MRQIKHILITLIVFITAINALGQTYPVQSFVQVTPPYSSYLPDYADPFNNQMKVLLTLTDFTVASHQVKIKITMTGNGYSITTNDFLNLPPINLTPGVPVEISGSSLAPYLATENLTFTGIDVNDYTQRKVLPEGPCTICIEVIDFTSPNNTILGNPTCSQIWFARQQPPMLNQPFCGNNVQDITPQQILFGWTPMNMGGPMGLTTEYVFELFENNTNPDDAIDPNQIVNSTLPIFFQITNQTFVNYGIVEPQLQIGKEYIWRVQARNVEGRDLYINNGYSEVCTFTYGSIAASLADGIELQLQTTGTSSRQGYANWNANAVFDNYILEVRKTGDPNFEWFTYTTVPGVPTTDMKINSLEAETEYEARIKGLIGNDYQSDYSNTSVFTTSPPPNYACGTTTMPAVQPQITPLPIAIPGLIVSVGQFNMLITSVEPLGTPGHYKGRGKIPMLFIFMNLNVEFDDILIDDNLTVREGKVVALSDGIDAWEHNILLDEAPIYKVGPMELGDITVIPDSSSFTVNFNGNIVTFEFPTNGSPVILNSENGQQFIVWPDGTIEVGTWGEISDETLDAAEDYQVTFEANPSQAYGFDAFNPNHPFTANDYETILLDDDTKYYCSYKSTAENMGDLVIANVISPDSVLTGLEFRIDNDILTNVTETNGQYHINFEGLIESHTRYIYAYNYGDKIGRLRVVPYEEKEHKLYIIPVNGATINSADIQAELNDIYKVANTKFNVSVENDYTSSVWDLNNDGKLNIEGPDLFASYSGEMKALRRAYFDSTNTDYDRQALYIFVVPNFDKPSVDGYMVHNKSLGFVKSGATAKTVAHEIGHGAFDLPHTFPTIEKNTSDNLLDYGNGTQLTYIQWEKIFTNEITWSFLDDAEDGLLSELVLFTSDLFQENQDSDIINALDLNPNCKEFLTSYEKIIDFTDSQNQTIDSYHVNSYGYLDYVNVNSGKDKAEGRYTLARNIKTQKNDSGEDQITSYTSTYQYTNFTFLTNTCKPVLAWELNNSDCQKKEVLDEQNNSKTMYIHVPSNAQIIVQNHRDCSVGELVVSKYANNGNTVVCSPITANQCQGINGNGNNGIAAYDTLVRIQHIAMGQGYPGYRVLLDGTPIHPQSLGMTELGMDEHLYYFTYLNDKYIPIGKKTDNGVSFYKYVKEDYFIGLEDSLGNGNVLKYYFNDQTAYFDESIIVPPNENDEVYFNKIYVTGNVVCRWEFRVLHDNREKYIITSEKTGYRQMNYKIVHRDNCMFSLMGDLLCEAMEMGADSWSNVMSEFKNVSTLPEQYYNVDISTKPYDPLFYSIYSTVDPDTWAMSDRTAQLKFAFLAGIYNGIIQMAADIVEMVPMFVKYICNPQFKSDLDAGISALFSEDGFNIIYDKLLEDFNSPNEFVNAEMAGRYTAEIVSIVIPMTKVNWGTKIIKLISFIKNAPKLLIKFFKAIREGAIQAVKIIGTTTRKIVFTTHLNIEVALANLTEEGTILVTKWTDHSTTLIHEIGEIPYSKLDDVTGEIIEETANIGIVLDDAGDPAIGLVDNLVVSLDGLITKLDNVLAKSNFSGSGGIFERLKLMNNTQRRLRVYDNLISFRDEFIKLHGDVTSGIKSLDDVIDDFDNLVSNYSDVENVENYIDELMMSKTKFKGGAYGLEIINNPPPFLNNNGVSLIKFEASIDDISNCRFDLKYQDGNRSIFIETKNYASATTFSTSFYNQFKHYIQQVTNLEEIKYFFRNNNGVSKHYMIDKFKKLIKKGNNKQDFFDNLSTALKEDLEIESLIDIDDQMLDEILNTIIEIY